MKWGKPWGLNWGTAEKQLSFADGIELRGGLGITPQEGGRMQIMPSGVTLEESHRSLNVKLEKKVARLTRVFTIENLDDPIVSLGLGPLIGQRYGAAGGFKVESKEYKVLGVGAKGSIRLTARYIAESSMITGQSQENDGSTDDYAMSIGSQSVHVVRSIIEQGPLREQKHWPPPGGGTLVGPGINEIIGPDDNGVPQGTNIQERTVTWEETHVRDTFRRGFRRTITNAAQKLNKARFRGWEIGEVRFIGARVRRRRDLRWQVTYVFAIVGNQVLDIDYYDRQAEMKLTAVVSQLGHDYLWMNQGKVKLSPSHVFQTQLDDILGQEALYTATMGVHVAPVYKTFSFAGLYDREMPFRSVQ